MKLATTTSDFDRFLGTYRERVDAVCEAGFKYIDLSLYTVFDNDELLVSEKWRDNAKALSEYANEKGVKFVQAHSPGGNSLSGNNSLDESLIDITVRSIEICGILGIPNTVVHAGYLKGITKYESFERNREFFRRLIPAMEKNNVNVLCENSTVKNMGDMYFTNSGEDMKEFVQYVGHPLFHACWDTGHGNCEGNQYNDIKAIGTDLYALHINDNCEDKDAHLLPYLGTTNFDEVINALKDINYKGCFTFEACSSLRSAEYWLGNRRSFEKDKRISNPRLFMQKRLEKLMYEIGEYMLKAYDCFEE